MRGLIILAVLIITGFAFGDKGAEVTADGQLIKIHIDNPDCDTCVRTFDETLQSLIGIEQYDYNDEKHTLLIEFNPASIEEEWIIKALQVNGYQVNEV